MVRERIALRVDHLVVRLRPRARERNLIENVLFRPRVLVRILRLRGGRIETDAIVMGRPCEQAVELHVAHDVLRLLALLDGRTAIVDLRDGSRCLHERRIDLARRDGALRLCREYAVRVGERRIARGNARET